MSRERLKNLSLSEIGSYIKGDKVLTDTTIVLPDTDLVKSYIQEIKGDVFASNALEDANEHRYFYRVCPDFEQWFPSDMLEELFYTAKLGYRYEGVSAKLLYHIEFYKKNGATPNTLAKYIPIDVLSLGFTSNTPTVQSVIENVYDLSYTVIDAMHMRNTVPAYTEVYLPILDEVCVMSTKQANAISDDEARKATLDADGDVYTATLGKWASMSGRAYKFASPYDIRLPE